MKYRNMFKLFFSISLMLMFLCACGTAKEATQVQMVTDLFYCDTFYTFRDINPMEIKSLEVEKRQTHAEDGVDTVWVKVAAQNDSASGIMYYIMTYNLYNDGWHLEKVEENHAETWSFTPAKGPSEELIAQWLPDGAQIIDDTLWLEDGLESITYTYTESHRYCRTVRERCMTVIFDNTDMGTWDVFNVITQSEETTWDVCGRYDLYENGSKVNDTITIYEFSPDRIVWQLDSQPDNLREDDLVDVSSYSVNDYYMSYTRYPTQKEYALKYGYTFTITNVDWNEIRYASMSRTGNIFIGKDHIYAFDHEERRDDAKREFPQTLRYELIPIGK